MVIMHTADLHLKPDRAPGLTVLKWLVHQAQQNQARAVIVAGDFFDSDADAATMRPVVKKILDSVETRFYLLPGNHDQNSYRANYDYGVNVVQLHQQPFQLVEENGLIIVGVPYQTTDFSELIRGLPNKIDILIIHGTLYDRELIRYVADDDAARYLPIFPAQLENLARYVGLGHIHTRSFARAYRQTMVVNPGSAVALDTDCQTPRVYYRLDINEQKLIVKPFVIEPAPIWQRKELYVFPGKETAVLKAAEEHLARVDGRRLMPQVIIRGFTAEPDGPFLKQVEEIRLRHASRFTACLVETDIKSWDQIIRHPLVGKFIVRTAELEPNLKYKMYELVFPIFSELAE